MSFVDACSDYMVLENNKDGVNVSNFDFSTDVMYHTSLLSYGCAFRITKNLWPTKIPKLNVC